MYCLKRFSFLFYFTQYLALNIKIFSIHLYLSNYSFVKIYNIGKKEDTVI